jgi:hypothetical protein
MAKWVNADVLDGGLNGIKTVAIRMFLIKAYAAGDSYATVIGNALNAGVVMASADYTLSSSGSNRLITTGTKSQAANANSGATPDLHIAHTDGSAKVLWVTDETSDQVITSGNTINFPAHTYTSNQPT